MPAKTKSRKLIPMEAQYDMLPSALPQMIPGESQVTPISTAGQNQIASNITPGDTRQALTSAMPNVSYTESDRLPQIQNAFSEALAKTRAAGPSNFSRNFDTTRSFLNSVVTPLLGSFGSDSNALGAQMAMQGVDQDINSRAARYRSQQAAATDTLQTVGNLLSQFDPKSLKNQTAAIGLELQKQKLENQANIAVLNSQMAEAKQNGDLVRAFMIQQALNARQQFGEGQKNIRQNEALTSKQTIAEQSEAGKTARQNASIAANAALASQAMPLKARALDIAEANMNVNQGKLGLKQNEAAFNQGFKNAAFNAAQQGKKAQKNAQGAQVYPGMELVPPPSPTVQGINAMPQVGAFKLTPKNQSQFMQALKARGLVK